MLNYEKLFKELLVSLEAGLIVYDQEFKILLLSERAGEILGVKPKDVEGRVFSIEQNQEEKFKYLSQAMFPSLAPVSINRSAPGLYPQITDLKNNAPFRELRVVTTKVEGVGFLKLIEDHTKEAAALKSKNEFLAAAAHGLRTPALAVSWVFDGLSRSQLLGDEERKFVKIGHEAIQGLLKTVSDLLQAAQLDKELNLEDLNLAEFLEELLKEAEPVARQYQVEIYFDPGGKREATVSGDRVKLGMAVANLIDNAIKYNTPKGQVVVGMGGSVDKRLLQVSIKDTGIGIPPADLEKLFGKFFRGQNTAQTGVVGTGLGLYLAKSIIEQHGGRIWAESVLSRGSTFYFTLPIKYA